jgi:beta-lactamase regulating signal transducer with metallopeptidase domain
MSPVELMALSMMASVGVAALGLGVAAILDRFISEARLREQLWTGALFLPLLPPLAVGMMLFTPLAERQAVIFTSGVPLAASSELAVVAPVVANERPAIKADPEALALAVLVLAGLAAAWRSGGLIYRSRQLSGTLKAMTPATDEIVQCVHAQARQLRVTAPTVGLASIGEDPMLAGLWRPALVLPRDWVSVPVSDLIVRHELSHLKRGDHYSVWLEEALLIVLAFNPLVSGLRMRRAAAREEACDALALAGADAGMRQAYARRLIEALRREVNGGVPVLSFGGLRRRGKGQQKARRGPVMRRMTAILTPPGPAGIGTRLVALASGAVVLMMAGLASASVGLQRQTTPSLVLVEPEDTASQDWAWSQAALAPVYNSVWPGACGVSQSNGAIRIHLGEGCQGSEIVDPTNVRLQGTDVGRDPRKAFQAVKSACDAGQPVNVAWVAGGVKATAIVDCAVTLIPPVEPKALEVELSFDVAISPRPGDRLEVILEKTTGEGRYLRSMAFDLGGASIMPSAVRALVQQELFADNQAPQLTARLIGADGVMRAHTQDQIKPMIITAERAFGFADLRSVGPRLQ